jgi:hypothetical protein
MKGEIALFKLNLTVSHFTKLERTWRLQSLGAPLAHQWPLAARPHVGGTFACWWRIRPLLAARPPASGTAACVTKVVQPPASGAAANKP